MTRIAEIEQAFKDIFEEEEGLVQSIDTVYEMSQDENFYKLVISIHGLSVEDTLIIHTKFIFKVDKEKRNVVENYFHYLYEYPMDYVTIQSFYHLFHPI